MQDRTKNLLATALRPVPTTVVAKAAFGPGPISRVSRPALRGRDVVVAAGVARGMVVNPGRSNPEYALGTNEASVQDALEGVVKPGSVVYDVGSNVGFMTLVVCRLVGPEGYVYAFEPDTDNAAVIRHNLAQNAITNALVVCRAVGARTGPSELQLAEYSGGHAAEGSEPPPDFVSRVPVEMVTLDDFAATSGVLPPDVVKIDVEGGELGVLEGMVATLRNHAPTLLVEFDGPTPASHDARLESASAFLADRGYELERLPDAYPPGGWLISHWLATPRGGAATGGAERRSG